jgi:hypothetical protein
MDEQAAIGQCLPETDGNLSRGWQDKGWQAGAARDEPPE